MSGWETMLFWMLVAHISSHLKYSQEFVLGNRIRLLEVHTIIS